MGHLVAKKRYEKLGEKIDSLSTRVALNKAFYEILKEIYTEEEADFICKMPYSFASFNKIKRVTKLDDATISRMLESLCSKGLVMDIMTKGKYYYMIAPMVVGIFEFTMMRTGDNINSKKMASLFHEYMNTSSDFFTKNFNKGKNTSFMRTIPHEEVIDHTGYIEILSYEKASDIIEQSKKISVSICACRHEKLHLGTKCDAPLDICTSFDKSADYLIRNKLGKEISKTEMLEKLALSKELGLVLNADNVQKGIAYICHCCKCCCNVLLAVNKHGITEVLVTSSFIAEIDYDLCKGCGICEDVCPVNAIKMVPETRYDLKRKKRPVIDETLCLGCGVCGLKCKTSAAILLAREKRIIPPETPLQKIMMQCIERNTLQYQIFDDPNKITHKFARVFVGAFLKLPPVKRALMSDQLRSRFFQFIK
jgi:Pyruvate/2-oxoacid:ferredoxin oxidoreductase delta subunit